MPLDDAVPLLDDRRFTDIVAEIRTRIPRYTPEWRPAWNDLNDSDPGMVLAQTFAWLSEMLLYRMQQVPELQYLKFLQLIGIELLPARPAVAEITFAATDTSTAPTIELPKGTQVGAATEDGPPLVFETERPLTVLTARLESVQAYDGVYADATAANQAPTEGGGFFPFGEEPREDCAFVLGFGFPESRPKPWAFAPVAIDLAVFAADVPGGVRSTLCGAVATRAHVPAKLRWEGFDGVDWQAIDALNDETLAFTRSGHVVIRVPKHLTLRAARVGAYDAPDPVTGEPRPQLFWIRARLVRAQYERAPRLAAVRTNTVPAVQAQTVREEVLGGTTGERVQSWRLENRPVLEGSLRVRIDEGDGFRDWQIVDDLAGSQRTEEHLALDRTSGEIRADADRARAPVANPGDPDANVIATEYRFGGGVRGNVAAGEIRNLLTPVAGIDGSKTTNLFAAVGGTDEERVEDAKVRARRTLRARERAVSVEDFELLAKQAGNVRRARALPLVHPRFPGVAVPGAVTLIVVPDSGADDPRPSDALLRTVCAYLEPRRLLTTELHVVGPRYVPVAIEAAVVARDDADPVRVKREVEDALTRYLHPLTGGDDGGGWPFGGALRYSKVLQRAFVDGVDSVPALTLVVDGERQPECRDVPLPAHALVHPQPHAITVVTLREQEELP